MDTSMHADIQTSMRARLHSCTHTHKHTQATWRGHRASGSWAHFHIIYVEVNISICRGIHHRSRDADTAPADREHARDCAAGGVGDGGRPEQGHADARKLRLPGSRETRVRPTAYMCLYIYLCMYYTYTHTHTHTHVYIYIHIYIYIYVYIYV